MLVVVCVCTVLLQAALVLVGRNAGEWTFYLAHASVDATRLTALESAFATNVVVPAAVPQWQQLLGGVALGQQTADCLSHRWMARLGTSGGCLTLTHLPQRVDSILAPLSAPLLLLCCACANALLCAPNATRATVLRYAALAAFLVVVVSDVICYARGWSEMVCYPTLLVQALVLLSSGWYVYACEAQKDDDDTWRLAMYMQTVAVPVLTTVAAAMGARLWPDVLAFAMILSASTSALWMLQQNASSLLRGMCFVAPCAALLVAYYALGGNIDGWRQATAFTATVALVPFFLPSVNRAFITDHARALTVARWCVTGALLAVIVNLSLL